MIFIMFCQLIKKLGTSVWSDILYFNIAAIEPEILKKKHATLTLGK